MLALTNEDDVVYDPFAGVGSSLIAALKNRRRAYGTELVQEYIDIGLQRIQKLAENELKTRPIYQKIYQPTGKDKVSSYPTEWMENRLAELDVISKTLNKERRDLRRSINHRKTIDLKDK